MSKVNHNAERIIRLNAYAEGLRNRLTGEVPVRHKQRESEFKKMIEIDLKKTLLTIEKLKV